MYQSAVMATPYANFDDDLELAEGVFDSAARGYVASLEDGDDEPHLGLATTGQLLDELTARIELDGKLNYRTVDGN